MMAFAYYALVVFYALTFFRPEDLIPVLDAIPMAKIAGVIAIVGILAPVLAGNVRLTREVKILGTLYLYLWICIPTSIWLGGSFDLVVNDFTKMVVITITSIWVLNTLRRLSVIIGMQIASTILLCIIAERHGLENGRMAGVGNAIADPNDFALALCIILPFCVSYLLQSRSWFGKVTWISAIAVVISAIVATYSRGGFLALVAVFVGIVVQFKISRKAVIGLIAVLVCSLLIATLFVGTSSYVDRLKSISDPEKDASGSALARKDLLLRAIDLSLHHPLFGVGPGQFALVSGAWHATHNTYLEFSAEAGIPSLILFIMLIVEAFRNLTFCRTVSIGPFWYLTGALRCSLVGYLVGAFFLSTAYHGSFYLLLAYSAALRNISEHLEIVSVDATKSWSGQVTDHPHTELHRLRDSKAL